MPLATLLARIKLEGADLAQRSLKNIKQGFHEAGDAAKSMGHHATAAMRDMGRQMADAAKQAALLGGALGVAGGVSAFEVATKMDSLTRALASTSTGVDDLRGQLTRLREVAKLPGLGFEEAVQGSVKLQAAGLSANLAERALKSFGNALALAGGGKAELEGVTLALSQIASKSQLSAEEINQIAERVPQIRTLLKDAFGTADTEKIQQMGISSVQAIERIVAAAEKLPKASGGFQNALENFQDSLKIAIEPLGKGLAIAFGSADGPLQTFLGVLQTRMTQIGEVIAAMGKSGVIGEVIERLTGAFDGLFGNNLQERVAGFFANIASFVVNLPKTIEQTGQYLSDLFGAIGKNMAAAFEYARQTIEGTLQKVAIGIAGVSEALTRMLAFDPKGAMSSLSGVIEGVGIIDKLQEVAPPQFAELPEFKVTAPWADAGRFKQQIMGALGPMGDIPSDVIFGGKKSAGGASGGETENPIERLLLAIERNTKQAADSLSLRAQTLGGGELAGLGVTAAELRAAGASGFAPERYEYLPRVPASQMERAQRAMIREEIRRSSGKGRIF